MVKARREEIAALEGTIEAVVPVSVPVLVPVPVEEELALTPETDVEAVTGSEMPVLKRSS